MPRSQKNAGTPIRLLLLGPFQLERAHQVISLPRRKVEGLLAYLVLHPQEHAREHLAALFWGDSNDASARTSLRVALNTLRTLIGDDLLDADRTTVTLNPAFPVWCDAPEFTRLGTSGAPGHATPNAESLAMLETAVNLYRGDLLAGFYDDWVLALREVYRERYLQMLAHLAQAYRAAGEYTRAIGYARQILATDPAQEQAHQQLMFCYWRAGNRHAALEQFQECKNVLAQELGVEPARETIELYERIKASKEGSLPAITRLTNLPSPLTSFVGRQNALETLKELVGTSRLVTLGGPGGCGKTRLAIELAHRVTAQFADGVWWIPLDTLNDPALVPDAIARTLAPDTHTGADRTAELVRVLQNQEMLLVIDNCEHLIEACAQVAEQLLQHCSLLKILATSREPLNIAGEVAWLVPPLVVPQEAAWLTPQALETFESIRLFVERARAVRSDFALTNENKNAVVEICARLDGIPLALELAAARTRALSIQEIADRLDDRFRLLTGGSRTALPRQQTLHNLIEWSFQMLTASEQLFFVRLAVFVGGFDLEALEAICGCAPFDSYQVMDLLARLVEKSLVNLTRTEPARYGLLETIREYAQEQANASGSLRAMQARHANYFIELVARTEPRIGGEEIPLLNRQNLEYPNIAAALEWAIANGQAEAALTACIQLWSFWFRREHYAAASLWLARALDVFTVGCPLRVRGLQLAGALLRQQGQYERAAEYLRQAHGLAEALHARGQIGWELGALYIELGTVERDLGNYARAIDFLSRSWEILRDSGNLEMMESLFFLADIKMRSGDLQGARPLWEEGVARARALDTKWYLGWALGSLGEQARFEGQYEQALEHLRASIRIKVETRDLTGIAFSIETMANTYAQFGQPERATVLWGGAEQLRRNNHSSVPPSYQADYDVQMARAERALGAAAFERARARGRDLSMEELVAFALE